MHKIPLSKTNLNKTAKIIPVNPELVSACTRICMKELLRDSHDKGTYGVVSPIVVDMAIKSLPKDLQGYLNEVPMEKMKFGIMCDSTSRVPAGGVFTFGRTDNEYIPVIQIILDGKKYPVEVFQLAVVTSFHETIFDFQEIIEEYLEHELRHYLQYLGSVAIEMKNTGSVNFDKMIKKIGPYGVYGENDDYDSKELDNANPSKEAIEAYFTSSLEFHPMIKTLVQSAWNQHFRLLIYDAIVNDGSVKSKSSLYLKVSRMVSAYISSTSSKQEFLKILKNKNPHIYNRALKFIHDEVQRLAIDFYDRIKSSGTAGESSIPL